MTSQPPSSKKSVTTNSYSVCIDFLWLFSLWAENYSHMFTQLWLPGGQIRCVCHQLALCNFLFIKASHVTAVVNIRAALSETVRIRRPTCLIIQINHHHTTFVHDIDKSPAICCCTTPASWSVLGAKVTVRVPNQQHISGGTELTNHFSQHIQFTTEIWNFTVLMRHI